MSRGDGGGQCIEVVDCTWWRCSDGDSFGGRGRVDGIACGESEGGSGGEDRSSGGADADRCDWTDAGDGSRSAIECFPRESRCLASDDGRWCGRKSLDDALGSDGDRDGSVDYVATIGGEGKWCGGSKWTGGNCAAVGIDWTDTGDGSRGQTTVSTPSESGCSVGGNDGRSGKERNDFTTGKGGMGFFFSWGGRERGGLFFNVEGSSRKITATVAREVVDRAT